LDRGIPQIAIVGATIIVHRSEYRSVSVIVAECRSDTIVVKYPLIYPPRTGHHSVDTMEVACYAMDLNPLVENESLDPTDYVTSLITEFTDEIQSTLTKLK